MKFEPNFLHDIKYAHCFLATPSKRIKGVITHICNKQYDFKLRECSQITFDVYKLEDTTFYNELAFLMKVYIENVGWFIISEEPSEKYGKKSTRTKLSTRNDNRTKEIFKKMVCYKCNFISSISINKCWLVDIRVNFRNSIRR